VVLGSFPTPLEAAPRLSAAVGTQVWVKREDLSGLALGGNKTRQLEALMAAAIGAGADCLVATAAAQSNFCRTVAAAGAKLGLEVHLLLRGAADNADSGNLLLDRLLGAEISFTPTLDPYAPDIAADLAGLVDRLRAAGRRPHLLHMAGSAAARGAAAYVPMAEELLGQFAAMGIMPEGICMVASSGLSAAGLALGLQAAGAAIPILGICAQTPAAFLHPLILQRAEEARELLGLRAHVTASDIELDEGFIGPGYGRADATTLAAMDLAARTEALILDPVYTGKAMAGLAAHARAGRWAEGGVVFIHSGGAPGLFAYGGDRLAAHRQEA
jgi:D-cysteine desulfhydrase/L-cysteate sulfo-lyase